MPALRLTTDEYFRMIQFADGEFESRRFLSGNEIIRSNVLPDFARSVASILI